MGWASRRDGVPPVSYAPFRRVDPAVLAVVLGLLRLESSDVFVDLGCGDGAVLEAAGAVARVVVGVEIDPRLALRAHERLVAAEAAGRLAASWRVLNEPIGWTAPSGLTAGFVNLLPFAAREVSSWLARSVTSGFRVVVVGGWLHPVAGFCRVAAVDVVEVCGREKPVELWKFGGAEAA